MSRVALIRNGVVENVIEADVEFAATLGYDEAIETLVAGPGWRYDGGEFQPPPEPAPPPLEPEAQLTPLAFTRRFTLAERILISSSEDPIVQDGMMLVQLAQYVRLDDPDTVALVRYIQAKGHITEDRADAVLGVEEEA